MYIYIYAYICTHFGTFLLSAYALPAQAAACPSHVSFESCTEVSDSLRTAEESAAEDQGKSCISLGEPLILSGNSI